MLPAVIADCARLRFPWFTGASFVFPLPGHYQNSHRVSSLEHTMDFSAMNPAEQAHMSKVIEKKQVSSGSRTPQATTRTDIRKIGVDAGFHENVLVAGRTLLQLLLQRLHKQGSVVKRGEPMSPPCTGTPDALVFAMLMPPQEQCVMNCTDKFLKHSERVGARFAEQNAGACTIVSLLRSVAHELFRPFTPRT